jgi:hypothetical protein
MPTILKKLKNGFIFILCLMCSKVIFAGEVSETYGIQIGVPQFLSDFFKSDKKSNDEPTLEYSEGFCLGFLSVNCFKASQNSKSKMQVIKNKDSLIINFGTLPEVGHISPIVNPPLLLPLAGLNSNRQLQVYGGLTELIPSSGIYAVSMHVLKRFGLSHFLSLQKNKIKLYFYIFSKSSNSSDTTENISVEQIPDLVLFSAKKESVKQIKLFLQQIHDSPSRLGPEEKWISWHFAQNSSSASEERFSSGSVNRKTADGNYFLLDLNELQKSGKSLTHASSGALIQNQKSGHFMAIVQCYQESTGDVYAFNLESLDPESLNEVDQKTLEQILQNFTMPNPPGLQSDECTPLDGGPGDRKGGGGSYGPETRD